MIYCNYHTYMEVVSVSRLSSTDTSSIRSLDSSRAAPIEVEIGETTQIIQPDHAFEACIVYPNGLSETWDVFVYQPPEEDEPYETTNGMAFFRKHYTAQRVPEQFIRQIPLFANAHLISDCEGKQEELQNCILEVIQMPKLGHIKPVKVITVTESLIEDVGEESMFNWFTNWVSSTIARRAEEIEYEDAH